MGILDGGKLTFRDRETHGVYNDVTYTVLVDVRMGGLITLGTVESVRVSTDRQIGRLRSPGKGRRAWRAKVRMADAQAVEGFSGGRELYYSPYGHLSLWIGWSGKDFETRREAGEALAAWYDKPEERMVEPR